ncbi:hypothetical protein [Ralstonia mannitolilytica]|uniref:hypothetical protein n=2 Tax=Ralstonia mannitolilytica TaxID=105219 RepID=UPI0029314A8E|nr:hypothetical protein [Ralstonia mannitolilytica]
MNMTHPPVLQYQKAALLPGGIGWLPDALGSPVLVVVVLVWTASIGPVPGSMASGNRRANHLI